MPGDEARDRVAALLRNKSHRRWALCAVAIVYGVLARWVILPSDGFSSFFLGALVLAALEPVMVLPLGLLVALPAVLGALVDPYYAPLDMRLIAVGMFLCLGLFGASSGRLLRRFLDSLRRGFLPAFWSGPGKHLADRLAVVTLVLLGAVGWVSTFPRGESAISPLALEIGLDVLAAAGAFAVPSLWFECGVSAALAMVLGSAFTDSNLAPFVMLGGVIAAFELVISAGIGGFARLVLARLWGIFRKRLDQGLRGDPLKSGDPTRC